MSGKITPFLRASTGLNNKDDPVRLKFDPQSGSQELSVAVNVNVDNMGRISRRKGFTKVQAGSFHSLWCDGGNAFVVGGSTLYQIGDGGTLAAVTTLTSTERMSYCQVAADTYYSNGTDTGIVTEGVRRAWAAQDYVGPETQRTFKTPPAGKHLELFNGRMYMASGRAVFYTEPFAYSWVDYAQNWLPFGADVRMIRSVRDGLIISDSHSVYFVGGASPKEFSIYRMAQYPAVEWTDTKADGGMVMDGALAGNQVVLWMSPRGICVGGPGGYFRNLTERKLVLPSASIGAGAVIDDRYVGLLES